MRKLINILVGSLQTIILTIAIAVMAVVSVVYVVVHSELNIVKNSLIKVLSEQIGSRVTVDGALEVSWDNQIVINNLTIYDQQDEKFIYARRAMVAYELWPLLSHHLVLNTCQLIDFDINTYRASNDSVANFQFFIDAFRKKDPNSQPFIQQLDLNAIFLRQGKLSYNVQDKPRMTDLPIDPYHIEISEFSANVHIHDKDMLIKKMHCTEQGTAYRAEQIQLALDFPNVLKAPAGEHRMLISVKGLEANGQKMILHADIDGDSDTIDINLSQLTLPNGLAQLKGINRAQTKAFIKLSQLKNPVDSMYISADIHELDLDVEKYGPLRINGSAEGSSYDAMLTCDIAAQMGAAQIQANLHRNDLKHYILEGNCTSEGIDLGAILPHKAQLGKAVADLDFSIEHLQAQPLRLSLAGNVDYLEWKGHSYHDIRIDCNGHTKMLKGNIALNDSLGDINAAFDIDMTQRQKHVLVDGTVRHFNPYSLNLIQVRQMDSLTISGDIHANVHAANLQEATADIRLRDITISRGDSTLSLGTLDYQGTPLDGRLNSKIAKFQYSQRPSDREYHITGHIATINELLSMLRIPVSMSKDILFEARIDSTRNLKQGYLDVPEINLFEGNYVSANLRVNNDERGTLFPMLDLDIHNAKHQLKGTLKAQMLLDPQILTIEPTTFEYNDQALQLDNAHGMRDAEGNFILENIRLTGGQQEVTASGIFGKNGDKEFLLSLSEFDLSQIFSNIDKGYLQFGGRATGDIVFSDKTSSVLSSDNLSIQGFSYIGTELGDADLNLAYDLRQKTVDVSCDISTQQKYNTHIDCGIDMSETSTLDLQVHPDHLPLDFIDYWVGDILQQFKGEVTGDVRLYGDVDHLQLAGTPFVDGRFTHQMLGAHFHLTDTVRLTHDLIALDHAKVDDEHGHPLTLTALIPHHNLHGFGYKVNIDMPKANQGFLVLDRPEAPGRMYWGQIYAQGNALLEGGNGKHRIDVDFSTTDKSWIFLSPGVQDINPDQEAYTFLTFRDKNQLELLRQQAAEGKDIDVSFITPNVKEDSSSDIIVTLHANATDQCLATVQLDPTSEDLISARGNGQLTIVYNPRRDLSLIGEYKVTRGTYTMNVKPDIINKQFQLQNTSTVSFNGVPSEANINLDANYNIPSVNLSDLGENVAALNSLSRNSVSVDCKMNVSGQLASPQIKFDLEVKNGNKEADDIIRNTIGTQEMINQQVLYLLLFSKFYPPQDVQTANQSRAGSELTSLASASIASQINQLLSRVSDNVTLGTNFKSDKGDFSDMEMDLSLSTRLLNDRLLLYGNVGYRDPANRIGGMNGSNSFIGDFDIEYIINNARTFRAKVYSHYNERDYSINNALTTQGVGLILRHDFNTFRDIWRWKNWTKTESSHPDQNKKDEK